MKRISLLFLALCGLQAADIVTVDPSGTVVVAGVAPAAPAAGATEVRMGGGRVASTVSFDAYFGGLYQANFAANAVGPFIQWRQSGKSFAIYDDLGVPQVNVAATTPGIPATGQIVIGNGTVAANNATIKRITDAASAEVVNGNDSRLRDSRVANGGNADTVGGKAPAAFVLATEKGVPYGVATLDGGGMIPAAAIPAAAQSPQATIWQVAGTFSWTVPAGWGAMRITLAGGGSSGYIIAAIPTYGIPTVSVGGYGGVVKECLLVLTPGTVLNFTIGAGGTGGGAPTTARSGGNTRLDSPGLGSLVGNGGGPFTSGTTTTIYGTAGNGIARSAFALYPVVGPGGAAGGFGVGRGGLEVAGGAAGSPGVLGGGGSGPSTLNDAGRGGDGCVIIQRIAITSP